MKKRRYFAFLLMTTMFCNSVFATQTLLLNTGYNHDPVIDAPYTPTTQDNYWIRIGGTSAPPVASSWAINTAPLPDPWTAPFPNSTWINSTNSWLSLSGVNPKKPNYQIYKKCFCLLKGFNKTTMKFQLRADDNVAIWLNYISNQVLPLSAGNWNGIPFVKNDITKGFIEGKNCIYVMVGDFGTETGFNLAGNVTSNGLLSTPAFGVASRFQPCGCEGGLTVQDDAKIVEQILGLINRR